MNKIKVTILFILLAFTASSQNNFKRFAHAYKSNTDYFYSEISNKTIQAYLKSQPTDTELTDALKNISSIQVMRFFPESKQEIKDFLKGTKENFKLENYVAFKSINSEQNNQLVYLKEQQNVISNLLVINTSYTLISLVEIQGDIQIEKLASVQRYFNIDGLENVDFENTGDQPDDASGKISVYNQNGHKLIESSPSTIVKVNGHEPNVDFQTLLKDINPNCIHNISIQKARNNENNDQIKIELEGNEQELYTVCEGVLYFGQNGYLHSIVIDDECSPKMLLNCNNHPLKDIELIEPDKVKSIHFTTNPRNCKGQLNGEFVVLETN